MLSIQKFIDGCRGRHTAFAAFFTVMGTILQWAHKLDANYIGLITVVQGWVFARSWSEDKYKKADAPKPQDSHDNPSI